MWRNGLENPKPLEVEICYSGQHTGLLEDSYLDGKAVVLCCRSVASAM